MAAKRIVVATNNAHKVEEIGRVLAQLGWECLPLRECGTYPEPVEDASTFEGNALIKARAAHENTGLAALADDSGLMVDALDGAPGVHSARFASEDGGNSGDEANNAKLLRLLEGVPDAERTARYVCALAFVDEDGTETVVRGTCEGRIGHEPAGSNGFGYDPYFLSDDYPGQTLAQVEPAQKDAISHRGKALRAFVAKCR